MSSELNLNENCLPWVVKNESEHCSECKTSSLGFYHHQRKIKKWLCTDMRPSLDLLNPSIMKKELWKTNFSTSQHKSSSATISVEVTGTHWCYFVPGYLRCHKKGQHPHLLPCYLHSALCILYAFPTPPQLLKLCFTQQVTYLSCPLFIYFIYLALEYKFCKTGVFNDSVY